MKDSIRYIFFLDLAFLLLTLYLGDLSKSIHPELLYSFLTAAWGPTGMDSNLLSWLLFVAVQIVCTFSPLINNTAVNIFVHAQTTLWPSDTWPASSTLYKIPSKKLPSILTKLGWLPSWLPGSRCVPPL